jgi:septal ring factor EnvC (AmiA/AmiB activator)
MNVRPQGAAQPIHAPLHGYGPGSAVAALLAAAAAGLVGIAALALMPAAGHAQAESQQKSGKARDAALRKQRQEKQLERIRAREAELRQSMTGIAGERAELNKKLLRSASDVQQTEARLTEIEARLKQLGEEEKVIRRKLSVENRSITSILSAIQRMSRNPPPVIITRRKDALKMVRSGMQLRYLFPKFKGEIDELRKELTSLVKLVDETKVARAKERSEIERLRTDRIRLDTLVQTKQKTLLSQQSELVELKKTEKVTLKNVAGLNELIDKLDKAVEEKTNLGKYNRKTASLAPARRPRLPVQKPRSQIPEATPPSQAPAATSKPSPTIELTPSGKGQVASPGRLEPAIPFHLAKARLPMPAYGRKVIDFGDKTAQGGRSKGIVIKTRHGASITSPCDGWVVYAGAFRSYGQLLIINAGGGYHVLLANLSRLDVQLGQFILAAEPVGSMAGVARGKGKVSDPVLYVEFRKNGRPVDPGPWWTKGQQRVQG